jgi:methanethiol S-methyltransferase
MPDFVFNVLIIILLFTVFGFLHSFLASNKVKRKIEKKFEDLIAFYRLVYIIFSFVLLYFIYDISPQPHLQIYDLTYPYDFIILIPQIISLFAAVWTFKYFNAKEFLGINQLIRWSRGEYEASDLDEKLTLRVSGPYKYMRHPVYFFSILFLLFRAEMDLFYLTLLICVIAYFYIGSFYEEKKLVEKFGNIYLEYQKNVPRIFPYKLLHPYEIRDIV